MRNNFPQTATCRYEPLELVHSDLHGPLPPSPDGYKYWITFTDDCTRFRRTYVLQTKGQAFDALKQYHAWAEKQTGYVLRELQDDKGGEYMSNVFRDYCLEHGIQRCHTTRATPQQYGVAERTNNILDVGVATLLSESGLPATFWVDALSCFIRLLNMSPASALHDMTPHEAWH